MTDMFTVLDGTPHTGRVLRVAPEVREVTHEGVTYRDTGHVRAHEQHDWVRWFRRADLPPLD